MIKIVISFYYNHSDRDWLITVNYPGDIPDFQKMLKTVAPSIKQIVI